MKCPFCGTEIRKILKPPLLEKSYGQAWERCPLEYECEGCIHVWLTKGSRKNNFTILASQLQATLDRYSFAKSAK